MDATKQMIFAKNNQIQEHPRSL